MRATLGESGRLAAWATALVLLAACGRSPARNAPPEPGDKAVATVDGQTVWVSDVKRQAAAEGVIGEGEPLDVTSAQFHQVLDEVIDQKLLAAEAVRRKLQNDPSAKRAIAAARERILGDRLVQTVTAAAVTDQTIEALYRDHQRLAAQTEEFRARQIVSASPGDAAAVAKQVSGGAAFEAVAMERSTDAATRFNGGDLGYFTVDVMPSAYAAALAPAKIGDVVGPFKSDSGWVLLKVEDRRPEQPIAMEAARPQIVRFLTYEEVGRLLTRLRGKAQVKLLIGPVQDVGGAPREPASAPPLGQAAPPAAAVAPAPAPPPPPPPVKPAPPPAPVRAAPSPHPPALPKLRSRKVRPSARIMPAPSESAPNLGAPAPIQPPPVSNPSEPQP